MIQQIVCIQARQRRFQTVGVKLVGCIARGRLLLPEQRGSLTSAN
jgi:hypothetical protein